MGSGGTAARSSPRAMIKVALRRGDARVPEQLRNCDHVATSPKRADRIGVPKRMRADRLRSQAGLPHRLSDQVADRPGREARLLAQMVPSVVRPEERPRVAQPTSGFGEI